jgi:exonuclease SbcD
VGSCSSYFREEQTEPFDALVYPLYFGEGPHWQSVRHNPLRQPDDHEPLKILHTSDWHLGRALYGRNRYREFGEFLDWLADLLCAEQVDLLLVAGDVFDTTTPGNRAQELYYRFLHRVAGSSCCHVVVTGGNHDSPSFLNAPKALLQALNVHVAGSVTEDPEEEVLVLRGRDGNAEAVVCAVPYLRDRDIRTVEAGESPDDKSRKLLEGIERHYAEVCRIARLKQQEIGGRVPLVVMGHLFAAGGKTVEGDGVREIYVGSLARVSRLVFPDFIDYAALGHLHVAQTVGGAEHIRYSGSPIPMGFGEASQPKSVVIATWSGAGFGIRELPVPCFQPLERITGTIGAISARILELKAHGSDAWIEIEYTGDEPAVKLREVLDDAVRGTAIEIRRVKNNRIAREVLQQLSEDESLDELQEEEVFERCLEQRKVPEADRPGLRQCYREVLLSIHEEDRRAEEGEGA